MRAKEINQFKRGQDVKKSLRVGKERPHRYEYLKSDSPELSDFGMMYMRYSDGGGNFTLSLFKAFINGTEDKKVRLLEAFPEYFNERDIGFNYTEKVYLDEEE